MGAIPQMRLCKQWSTFGQADLRGCPASGLGGKLEVKAVARAQFADNGEAQPLSLRCVSFCAFAEHLFQLFRRNADTIINDMDCAALLMAHTHQNAACV